MLTQKVDAKIKKGKKKKRELISFVVCMREIVDKMKMFMFQCVYLYQCFRAAIEVDNRTW